MAAVLYVRCHEAAAAGSPLAVRSADRAVECLRRALAKQEVNAAAARHPNFAPLRGRADYEALIR